MSKLNGHAALPGAAIVVTVGGEDIRLPKLALRDAQAWRRRSLAAYSRWARLDLRSDALGELAGILEEVEGTILDLIVDYDRAGVLGGREPLERRILPSEIGPVFAALLASVLPFDPATQLVAPLAPGSTSTTQLDVRRFDA